MTVKL